MKKAERQYGLTHWTTRMPESLGIESGRTEGSKPGQERLNPKTQLTDILTQGPTLFLLLVWMSFSGGSLTSTTWSRRPSGSSEYESTCPRSVPMSPGAPVGPRQVDTCLLHLLTLVEVT